VERRSGEHLEDPFGGCLDQPGAGDEVGEKRRDPASLS
jgi:hypothetical protein